MGLTFWQIPISPMYAHPCARASPDLTSCRLGSLLWTFLLVNSLQLGDEKLLVEALLWMEAEPPS